ncbi:MAG TPA: malectin domain-containing carbohydrate-binding protein, partial [Pyrinomonadaceae bacterium]
MSKPRIRRKSFLQPFSQPTSISHGKSPASNRAKRVVLLVSALLLLAGVALVRSTLFSNAVSAQASVVRLNSGGSAYLDSQNQQWSADNYFQNGSTYSVSSDIVNTSDDALYQTERYGGAA